MGRIALVALVTLVALVAAGAAPAAGATGDRALSDEHGTTRWSNPARVAVIRTRPNAAAPAIGRTRIVTEDDRPEVYLLLTQRVDAGGTTWVRLRVPGRPNGRVGWVVRDALGPMHAVHTAIDIDRATHRLTVRRDGRVVLRVPVGVGAPATPTPAGRFWIRSEQRVAGATLYGPRALGTSAYARVSDWPRGGIVGIHGTDQPELIGTSPSHGCVRLRNADVVRLARLVSVGTPVRIR